MQGLNTLDLSNNLIKKLPERVFFTMGSLYSLSFAHNKLENPNGELFIDNIYLTKLDLSDNDLGEIDKKIFRYNKNIRKLNVSSNFIEDISFIREMDIIRLEDIDISDNPLHEINFTFFGSMRNLQKLNVGNTGLTSIDFTQMGRLKNLYQLNISSNQLGELNFNETVPFDNLVRLYINFVGVKSLDSDTLKKALPNLKYLSVVGNQWRCNYLNELKNKLKAAGVEYIDHGTDCSPINSGPAQLVAIPINDECINDVALARIKVKETIDAKLKEVGAQIQDEVKRIINKRTIEIYNEISAFTNKTLSNVIT